MNNRKAAPGINPPSNPTRPKERKIGIRQTLFLNSPFSILNSLRFVLLCLFLPAISLSIGQVPGTPYGVQSLDCSSEPATPGTITLSPVYVTANTPFTARIDAVAGAKSYEWVLDDDLSVSGSSNDRSITVTATRIGTFTSSAIKVKAINDCGSSATVSLSTSFQVKEPGTSDRSNGKTSPCSHVNKAACTCDKGKGTPVFYGKATNTQRDAALGYFSHQYSDDYNSWFKNNADTDNSTMIHSPYGTFNNSVNNNAVAVCFD